MNCERDREGEGRPGEGIERGDREGILMEREREGERERRETRQALTQAQKLSFAQLLVRN